jgi:hypothetical protein
LGFILANHLVGPSEVCAANIFGINLFLLAAVTKFPEGVVVGFQTFAWAANSHKYKDSNNNNKILGPP